MHTANQGETWRFHVECPGAERVYLVREPEVGPSAWIEMRAVDSGFWEVTNHLAPGRYRFRYFRADGETIVNCGDYGLCGERLTRSDPGVMVEPMRQAVPA